MTKIGTVDRTQSSGYMVKKELYVREERSYWVVFIQDRGRESFSAGMAQDKLLKA